jgi:hypothetical protein
MNIPHVGCLYINNLSASTIAGLFCKIDICKKSKSNLTCVIWVFHDFWQIHDVPQSEFGGGNLIKI